VWRSQGAPIVPLLLVIGAGMAWASANIIVKRIGRIDMLALVAWGSLVAAPSLFALSLVIEGPGTLWRALSHPSWRSAGAVAFLAYPSTLLALALWSRLLSRYPAATVTPFALLVPVAGIASTNLLLGESLGHVELAGAGIILAGLTLNIWGHAARHKQSSPAEDVVALTRMD
jgi:O-acetylserine/cysteine efflux transporter